MNAPQHSPEWFQARLNRITASRVGAILSHSPYATPDDAMRSMVRESLGAESEFTGNVATQWGTNMEAFAIADFEMDTGLTATKTGFHEFEDFAGASPDGLIGADSGLEMKAPFGIRNDQPPVFKSLADQPHYLDQVQFSMVCLDRPQWYFAQWTPYGSTHEIVMRSQEWADKNMPILRQFYTRFLHERDNNAEEHLAPRRVVIDTPAAAKAVAEWDELCEQAERVAERKKDLLAEMVALAGNKDALFGGRKLTLTRRSGSVAYAKALKALCPDADVEKWRGAPSESWGLK